MDKGQFDRTKSTDGFRFEDPFLFRINYDKYRYVSKFSDYTRIVSSSSHHVQTTPDVVEQPRFDSINARGLLSRVIIYFIFPPNTTLFTNFPSLLIYRNIIYTRRYIRDPFMEHLREKKRGGGGKRDDRNWNFNAPPKNEVTSERISL